MRSRRWQPIVKRSPTRRLDLIDVEYEELSYVDDPVEALKSTAPLIHEDRNKYKNAR